MSVCIYIQISEIYVCVCRHIYTLYIYITYIYTNKYIYICIYLYTHTKTSAHRCIISLRNSAWRIVSAMQVLDIIIFKRYFSCKPPLVPTRRQRESLKYSFILKLAQDQYWIWSFKYARMSWAPLFCFCSFVLGYLKKA